MLRTIYLGTTFDKEREVMLEWFRNHIKASVFFHYMQSELNLASASHIFIPYSCHQPQALHTKLSSFIYLHQVLHCPSVTGEAVKELIPSRKRRMLITSRRTLIPNISCCENQHRPPHTPSFPFCVRFLSGPPPLDLLISLRDWRLWGLRRHNPFRDCSRYIPLTLEVKIHTHFQHLSAWDGFNALMFNRVQSQAAEGNQHR